MARRVGASFDPRKPIPLFGCAVAIAFGCSSMTASEDSAKDFGDDGSGTGGASSGGSAGSAGTGGGLPPEEEHEESYTVPAVSGQWIWTANPESGRVAVIDAVSARVSTANAGLAPTYLAALGGASENESGAIVINVGSRDVSVFRATNGAVTSADKVPLGAPANRLSVSPSSRWAIAWSDASLLPSVDPTEGMQDVTVIDLGESPPKAERLSVGYRPSRVFIAADESHAFVVSEPSVSVIELGGEATASVLRDVEITSNPTEAPSARDVTVTPDGALFFVRRNDASYVEVVALDDGRRVSVNLTGVVTDLDLSPDGSSAFAVVRGLPPTPAASGSAGGSEGPGGTAEGGMGGEPGAAGGGGDGGTGGTAVESTLAVLPVDTVLGAPGDYRAIGIPGVVGSIAVSPSGDTALLYTNATASDRVVILDTSGARPRTRTVVVEAPVRAVIPARDGAHAVVLLGQAPGSTKPGGFALVPVKETFPPRIVGTDAPPASVAVGESHALVTIAGKDLPSGVYFARFPELHPEFIRLASTPLSTALMPDVGRGFVAQSHPEGRITFIDLVTGAPRTITGFELGAKVVTDD